jgi:tetratricopeptide (TPR) repeat protein
VALVPIVRILIALSGNPLTVAATQPPRSALHEAVQLFENFEDERAAAAFKALLARSPPGEIAAQAHAYLGLIAFNAFQPDEAKAEFRHALEANSAVDLPPTASPKARLAFGQVRRDLEAEIETGTRSARRSPPAHQPVRQPAYNDAMVPAVEPAPLAATAASPTEVEQAEPSRSHTAAYVLGGATLVLAGLAIYGGVEVLNYGSMVGAGQVGEPKYTLDQLNSARGPASFWAVGWPVAAGRAAAGVVGAALTW